MHTITYTPATTGVEETVTQVTRIEFDHHRKAVLAHSKKDGAHEIPFNEIRQID